MINEQSLQWLKDNATIWERQKVGNHKYLDDNEKRILQAIAKEVDPDRYFTVYGCDDCIRELIKFVFTAYESQTVPTDTPTASKSQRKLR